MLKHLTFLVVIGACVGVAHGGLKTVQSLTPTQAQLDDPGTGPDPGGMAVLEYDSELDQTIVQITVSHFTPARAYSVRLSDGVSEAVVPDAFTTDENGDGAFYHEFPLMDVSGWDAELFVGTTGTGLAWSQQPDVPPGAHGSNWNTQNIADDVAFAAARPLASIRWWGGTYSGTPVATFRVRFYANTSGLPGAVVYEHDVSPTSATLTGRTLPSGPAEYVFEADLPGGFTAAAGTTYWFEVVGYNTGGHGVFGWCTSTTPPAQSGNNAAKFRTSPTKPWQSGLGDRAFELSGEASTTEVRAVGITVLYVPADITIGCDESTDPSNTGPASAPENCGAASAVTLADSVADGSCPNESVITRTWSATDACGNSVAWPQTIVVVDTIAPVTTCPDNMTVECDGYGNSTDLGTWLESAVAEDACGSAWLSDDFSGISEGCGATGEATVTWTAIDDCDNAQSCSSTFTIADLTPPTVSAPPSLTVECDGAGNTAQLEAWLNGVSTEDACSGITVASDFAGVSDGCGATGAVTVAWTATDDCGNGPASAAATFTIADLTPPTVSAPPSLTVECDGAGNTAQLEAWLNSVSAEDACSSVVVASDFAGVSDGCGATGAATVTWTATDDCGNGSASAAATLAIEDTTAPELSVSTSPITLVDTDCSGGEPLTLPSASVTDACDASPLVTSDAPPALPAGETTAVTFTATDDCGNTSSAAVDATVKYGAAIEAHVHQLVFGWGCRPVVRKEPLAGVPVQVYRRPGHEFCAHHCGWWHGWHWWRHVFHHCDESNLVNSGVTDENGVALIDVPPGDYLVVALLDFDGDGETDDFLGHPARNIDCGETRKVPLRLLVTPRGKQLAAIIHRFEGSELLIVEPDLMVWDQEEQEYPFGFESEGDWGVTVTVEPPEGFVSDEDALSADVDDSLEAVQFTVTEVGSDLVPTETTFQVWHNGRRQTMQSNVGLLLTPNYARSRGFDVNALRTRGLITEQPQKRPAEPLEVQSGKAGMNR